MTTITSKKRLKKMLRRRMKMEKIAKLCEQGKMTVADLHTFMAAMRNPTAWGLSAEGDHALTQYAHALRAKYAAVPQKEQTRAKIPPTLQTAIRGAIRQAQSRAINGHHTE